MSSRHQGRNAFVVHLWGAQPFQHVWKVYATEAVAETQRVRMLHDYAPWSPQTEVFPLTGSGLPNPDTDKEVVPEIGS
jgi:hypothetical protein